VECFRRLLLASVIGIASDDSALAPVIGVLLCLAFLHLFSKRPFKEEDNSTLGIVLTYALAFIFLGALLIKVNAQPNGELESKVFELVLIFLLLMGPGIIIVNLLQSTLMKRFRCCKKQAVSEEHAAHRSSIELLWPRRKSSLVKGLDFRTSTLLPDAFTDGRTVSLHGGRHTDTLDVMIAELTLSRRTSKEDRVELNEINERFSRKTVVEDGVELNAINERLSRRTVVEDGVELNEIAEEFSLRSVVEDGVELNENDEELSRKTVVEDGVELNEIGEDLSSRTKVVDGEEIDYGLSRRTEVEDGIVKEIYYGLSSRTVVEHGIEKGLEDGLSRRILAANAVAPYSIKEELNDL